MAIGNAQVFGFCRNSDEEELLYAFRLMAQDQRAMMLDGARAATVCQARAVAPEPLRLVCVPAVALGAA